MASITVVAIATATVPNLRHRVLRAAGWALVQEDPPQKADLVVVASDAAAAGVLEAADLMRAGLAPRVALFERPPTRMSREFARRGLSPLDLKAFYSETLRRLGITDIVTLPPVVGTVDEGQVLQGWCTTHGVHSIIFISNPDHSRRTRRVLDRALGSQGIRVSVRYARFTEYDPDSWWRSRGGQRTQAAESEKLLLDYLRHPF